VHTLDFEIISKKGCFLNFKGLKPNFTTFDPPWKKILPTPMCMVKNLLKVASKRKPNTLWKGIAN